MCDDDVSTNIISHWFTWNFLIYYADNPCESLPSMSGIVVFFYDVGVTEVCPHGSGDVEGGVRRKR